MKTNNRPMVKLVEWEVRTKSDFLLWNSPDDTAIWDGERTGNTREVERPMNDTEYIEYLENKNKLFITEINLTTFLKNYFEKQNQELEEKNKKINLNYVLLQVEIPKIIYEHKVGLYDLQTGEVDYNYCSCGELIEEITHKTHIQNVVKKIIESGFKSE